MSTDSVISSLMDDFAPVPPHAFRRRLTIGVLVGFSVSFVALLLTLGARPDLGLATQTAPFWLKAIYTSLIGVGGVWAVSRLGRPDSAAGKKLWLTLLPFCAIVVLAVIEAVRAPEGALPMLVTGKSWNQCPLLISALSVPLLLSLLWVFRRFAPTRLRLSGLFAGLAAGGLSAFLYSVHCPEASMVFVSIWYSLGMILPAILGVILGPLVLKW